MKKHCVDCKIAKVTISESEVSVYDIECILEGSTTPIYINIKSAVSGGKKNKDDISKGEGLLDFYKDDVNKNFFVATFIIKFNEDMTIEIVKSVVFPIAWISDVYINPSNNGNLQSAYYKDISLAVKRSNSEFYPLFVDALNLANAKKKAKEGEIISDSNGNHYKKIKKSWKVVDEEGNPLKK